MSRTIYHSINPDESDWAMDADAARGIALGMTEQEAEVWSIFCDFVSTMEAANPNLGYAIPKAIAPHIDAIRTWMLARPQKRRLNELAKVEPIKTNVR